MNTLKRIFCFFGKHDLYMVRKLTRDTDLIGCKVCPRYWGMNHSVRAFLPFDYELYEMYTNMFKIKGLKKYITKDRPISLIRG